jgi:anaerobic C4-dicarboxylate transporter
MFEIFVIPVAVTVAIAIWLVWIDRSNLQDSGGLDRFVKRAERRERLKDPLL